MLIEVVSGEMRTITASHTAEPVVATSTARKQGSEVLRNYSCVCVCVCVCVCECVCVCVCMYIY